MKILVSGITGFIGRQLGHSLLDQGHRVVGVSRQESPDIGLCGRNRFDIVSLDLQSKNLLGKLPNDVECIFNYAALLTENHGFSDLVLNNVLTTYNLFEYAKKISATFIQASTGSVYSWDDLSHTIDENVRPSPYTKYGLSKYLADNIIKTQCEHANNKAYILRFPIIFDSQGKGNIVSELYGYASNGENIRLTANAADRKINIIHVRDVVNANISLMLKSNQIESGEVFLVGSNKSIKVSRLAEKIIEDLESQSDVEIKRSYDEAPPNVIWDTSKTENILEINPRLRKFS